MRSIRSSSVVLGLALCACGCVVPFKGPGDLRREIESVTGQEYDRTFALTVGRSGLALARWAVRESGEEEIPLEGVHKVEIGVYQVPDHAGLRQPRARIRAADLPDLSPVVEVDGEGETALILSESEPDGSVRRLLVIVEEGEELTLVRLTGHLDDFMEQAIAYALRQANRPEMVDPALEEYRRSEEAGED